MKVINLYGGPGTGKSTTAADLFAKMKWAGYNVELVDEYAKKVTWEGHHNILDDQIYLLAKQNRRLERLRDQVDWVITDSPIMLCKIYTKLTYYPSFQNLVREIYDSYVNVNIMLVRQKEYSPIGRGQTETEARELDSTAEKMLRAEDIPFWKIPANPLAKDKIFKVIERL